MSYCRWSSDDFQSDVYVYEDCRGPWVVHVAGRRHVISLSGLPEVPDREVVGFDAWFEVWHERHELVSARIDKAETVPIDHPAAGESRYFDTPGEAADWLDELAATGLHVPDGVCDALRDEMTTRGEK